MKYLTFYLGLPTFILFLYSLFPREFWKPVPLISVGLGAFFSLIVLLMTAKYYTTYIYKVYQFFFLILMVYAFYILGLAVFRKREGSRLFLSGYLILFLTILNEILHERRIVQTGHWIPLGLFLFTLFQSFVLSKRFSKAFSLAEVLTSSYERFVPQDFLKLLKKESIVDVEIGDQVHNRMSILFSDIRSFTSLSETMTPQENFNFLNAYLKRMEPSIGKFDGVVDKFIGDAIMALFPKRADDSLLAAISMQNALREYNEHRKRSGNIPIKIGIGINTGDVMLGTIGAHNRMEGTVISDAVNLGARIEGLTKIYGASILISENTFHQLENPEQFEFRVVDQVVVKGKTESVTVFEVFNGDIPEIREAKLSTTKLYEQAISTYSMKNFEEALTMFQECVNKFPEDKVAQIYIDRCNHFLKVGWDKDWDGVERLESK